jgi:hypothetical protein
MMMLYGDVHRVGEEEVRVLFEEVPVNIEENCNKLQIGRHSLS